MRHAPAACKSNRRRRRREDPRVARPARVRGDFASRRRQCIGRARARRDPDQFAIRLWPRGGLRASGCGELTQPASRFVMLRCLPGSIAQIVKALPARMPTIRRFYAGNRCFSGALRPDKSLRRVLNTATPHSGTRAHSLLFKVAYGKDPREATLRHDCSARAVRGVLARARKRSRRRHQCEAARGARGKEAGSEQARGEEGRQEAGAEQPASEPAPTALQRTIAPRPSRPRRSRTKKQAAKKGKPVKQAAKSKRGKKPADDDDDDGTRRSRRRRR